MTALKALLVGAGAQGRVWGATLQRNPDVALAGWVDVRAGVAEEAATTLGAQGVYTTTDLDRAIADVQPDFVVDVTIPEAHHDVTLTALAAGIPVLGEKPMADSMEHARAMVAASERAGKLYMVSQSRRYDARIQAYRRLIATELGPLGILNADFSIGAHFGGFRDEMDHVLLLDMAIHTFDQARFLSGADPVAVYCEEYNPAWSWYRGAANATAIFEMTGGLRFTYRGSWCAEGCHTSWESEWRASGPHGTATWDGDRAIAAEIVSERGNFISSFAQKTEPIADDVPAAFDGSLRDFVHALRTGATPWGECHDNIKSLAMVFGAVESAVSGRRVQIEI